MTERPSWPTDERPWVEGRPVPACRVVIDNDFAGDPDGLFQLAHHLLSPSVDIRAIIASRMVPVSARTRAGHTVERGCELANDLFEAMGVDASRLLRRGSELALADRVTPRPSEGSDAIIMEAMRPDALPLYVVCGAGLTELASAYLREPAIADRLTAVWIGGPEYSDDMRPAGPPAMEYNLGIDLTAARVVVEDSAIPFWQVPRDVYRKCIVSRAELRTRIRTAGTVGRHLYGALEPIYEALEAGARGTGETFVLGDSPLVLLTALQTLFEPDTGSSLFSTRPAPRFADDGSLLTGGAGRPIRVYSSVDVRLFVEDLIAKLTELAHWQTTVEPVR